MGYDWHRTLLKGFEPAEVLRIPQVSFSPRARRFEAVGGEPSLSASSAGTVRRTQTGSPPLSRSWHFAPRRWRVTEGSADPGAGRPCGAARARSFFLSCHPSLSPRSGLLAFARLSSPRARRFQGVGSPATLSQQGCLLSHLGFPPPVPPHPRPEPFALGRPVPDPSILSRPIATYTRRARCPLPRSRRLSTDGPPPAAPRCLPFLLRRRVTEEPES